MKNCIYAICLSFVFLACSAKKNKPINKGYHSLVSSYNVLFNGSTSIDEGVQEEYATNKENFWDILPVEKIKILDEIITVSGINNKKFLAGEEKAAKTVQKHSMLIRGNSRLGLSLERSFRTNILGPCGSMFRICTCILPQTDSVWRRFKYKFKDGTFALNFLKCLTHPQTCMGDFVKVLGDAD